MTIAAENLPWRVSVQQRGKQHKRLRKLGDGPSLEKSCLAEFGLLHGKASLLAFLVPLKSLDRCEIFLQNG